MNVLDEIGRSQMKPKDQVPQFRVGDTVRVHFRIVEGEKERVQIFEGVVIGRKGGEGPLAGYLAERFRDLGLEVTMQEVEPGRFNVITTLKGTGGGKAG